MDSDQVGLEISSKEPTINKAHSSYENKQFQIHASHIDARHSGIRREFSSRNL
jgi:hypothetical protein